MTPLLLCSPVQYCVASFPGLPPFCNTGLGASAISVIQKSGDKPGNEATICVLGNIRECGSTLFRDCHGIYRVLTIVYFAQISYQRRNKAADRLTLSSCSPKY